MERISSAFFMLALLAYYIPKLFKMKKSSYVKAHIALGSISVITMVAALISKIGQVDFVKYIGFTIIMLSIGVTGYLINKNHKRYRVLHIVFTISFFVYLYLVVSVF